MLVALQFDLTVSHPFCILAEKSSLYAQERLSEPESQAVSRLAWQMTMDMWATIIP